MTLKPSWLSAWSNKMETDAMEIPFRRKPQQRLPSQQQAASISKILLNLPALNFEILGNPLHVQGHKFLLIGHS